MRQCLFCPSTKLNQEHIWPNWIVKQFRHRLPGHRGYRVSQTRNDKRILSVSANLEHTTRVVCRPCNEGWMSRVESAAKPELTSLIHFAVGVRPVTVEAQLILSVWATLRSMVFESLLPAERRLFTQPQREAFKAMLEPDEDPNRAFQFPVRIFVWLTMLTGAETNARLNVTTGRNSDQPGTDVHLANFSIGQAYFQVLAFGDSAAFGDLDKARMHEATTRLWPARDADLRWPPQYRLDVADWPAFAQRFFAIEGMDDPDASHSVD